MSNESTNPVENSYQGIFITETVLGNPNGSFVNNEPRNIDGRVFTTDKCIKYNIRNYIFQNSEKIEKGDDGKEVKELENFVFFYPRKTEDADDHEASFMTKDSVFEEYFDKNFDKLINSCPDARIFGGTFSFTGGEEKSIYGPVQISYGLDLIGADILSHRLGTPFSSSDGSQKTTGESKIVDHAVISYDITVNPKNSEGLLKESDLELFQEGILKGTNLRKSTSKDTDGKALVMIKFNNGRSLNIGELKHLIDVESRKITDPKDRPDNLILDFSKVKDRLDKYDDSIEKINIIKDDVTKIENFYEENDENVDVDIQGVHEL